MDRQKQVYFCQQCTNRSFDKTFGVICGLTNKPAEFENECSSFIQDEKMHARQQHIEAMAEIESDDSSGANKDMIWGALWCVGGIVATVADIGYIFYGAIIFGAIQFFKGLANSSSNRG